MGKGPFYRLLSKIFLTIGGLLAVLSLLYAQTTIDPPEPWNFREIALFPLTLLLHALTLAEPGLIGLTLFLTALALLLLGGLFLYLSKRSS
mgnify:CR=1 FL=1